MKNKTSLLLLPILAVGLSACSHEKSAVDLPPGQYEKSTSSTNANGTSVDKKSTATVGYDANGNKKAVVKSTTDVDPPGLFNKSTNTTTETIR